MGWVELRKREELLCLELFPPRDSVWLVEAVSSQTIVYLVTNNFALSLVP